MLWMLQQNCNYLRRRKMEGRNLGLFLTTLAECQCTYGHMELMVPQAPATVDEVDVGTAKSCDILEDFSGVVAVGIDRFPGERGRALAWLR